MAKLKFKDENGNFIPVVQDVKVNNNSVFDGKDANVNLKTINNQSILGFGNISIPDTSSDVALIKQLIPNQASPNNQLADKNFVNSTVATETATFKGTFDSLAELEEVVADNNDYAFYKHLDGAGNTVFDRYKYSENLSEWQYEYTLNNSSFTAAQWEAINSGVTEYLINHKQDIITNYKKGNPVDITDCVALDLNAFAIDGKTEQGANPSPSNPQQINNVEGTIQIKKVNKNFCKLDAPNLLMNSNNVIVNSNYPTTIINTKNFTSLCVTGDFSLLDYNVLRACGTNEYPALGVTGTKLTNIGSNNNIIDTTNYNYIMLTWIVSAAMTEAKKTAIEHSFQVEEGLTATSWVAHEEKTYNFPLSSGQKLMQGGTIENKIINTRRQIILNNSENENWGYDISNNIYRFYVRGYNTIIKGNTEVICDKFKYYSIPPDSNLYINGGVCNPLSGNISFCKADITSLNDWKAYIEANPILIEVELKEPDETNLTPEQQAVIDEIISDGTYYGETHYIATANINPDIEVIYYQDLKKVLEEMSGGGTNNYVDLSNKPSINGVQLIGNKTSANLGILTKRKTLTNSSQNYSVLNNVVTVTDNDVSTNTHVELFPADTTTEEWLENNLSSCIITEANGSFSFNIDDSLPATFSMYYLIMEVA